MGTVRGLLAFGLITLGVLVTKSAVARPLMRPLMRRHLYRAGVRLLPMALFLAMALGFVVIGQSVVLLSRVGAQDFAGTIMVSVVVRELGPLAAALLILLRVGTATVIELGTARALGEVEVLESLSIDPIHYLVAPRMAGMILGAFTLSIYLIVAALACGYVFAFLQDVPLTPSDYLAQLAGALQALDFVLVGIKALLFGVLIAVTTCYQGLARPLSLEDVSQATVRATVHGLLGIVALDVLFMVVFLAS
ncbi:ABC transporter permease [Fontisphaera persica]|uniref:MlaE family ABC transporter permease n=1 Tax=Fontisphaera persica TaxID=2974023 RepID=UPI0024C07FE8|nr:ABC transporter permease [Fontisphaera persica]WCJ60745.1 ABC transporter permease [Fontisphaera persica]